MTGGEESNELLGHRHGLDTVDRSRSLRTGANRGNFNIRLVAAEMDENGLKATFIAKIAATKVAKEGDLRPLLSRVLQIAWFVVHMLWADFVELFAEAGKDSVLLPIGARSRLPRRVRLCRVGLLPPYVTLVRMGAESTIAARAQ
jgi:hypothetical protein